MVVGWVVGCVSGPTGRPTEGSPAGPLVVDAAPTFRRGVHVRHWLGHLVPTYLGHSGVPHTYAAPWFDDEDLEWIAAHGFDHVQVHVDAEQWFADDGALDEPALAPFDALLASAGRRGLGVVLLLDGTPGATAPFDPSDPGAVARRTDGWRQVAARFAAVGPALRLRTAEDPEPSTESARERLSGYLEAIRASSPRRFVYLPVPLGAGGDPQDPLAALGEPTGWDDAVGLSFSYYRPELFVFQRGDQAVRVPWPGVVPDLGELSEDRYAEWYLPVARAAVPGAPLGPELVDAQIAALGAWVTAHDPGRELLLGEFGLYEGGPDPDAARRYLGDVVRAAERHQVGWSIYDYESGRAIRGDDGQPTVFYDALPLGG
ncbi:MAG: hypothetical protein ABMA64_03285 [Myxococcota bacterium]